MYQVVIKKSFDGKHKYEIYIYKKYQSKPIILKIGAVGYSDYILSNGDDVKKNAYIKRHQSREDWDYSGRFTAGFWSKNLLWNKPTLQESIDDIERRYIQIKIIKVHE